MDRTRLVELIEYELKKIVEKGFNTSNIDTAYKLVDMYKDLGNMNYWDKKMESMGAVHSGYEPKTVCSARVIDSLEEYMDDFTRRMEELADDAECADERQTIERYLSKIKSIRN